jgi:hypothetical protein
VALVGPRHLWPWLILGHRYLGIAIGVLFVIWFASGVAMIYVRGMPVLSADERLKRLVPLALNRALLSPADAAKRSGSGIFEPPQLFMILDRPVYRFAGAETLTVFADTGERVPPADRDTALRIAAGFLSQPPARLDPQERLTIADQWTLGQRRMMPLWKFGVVDNEGTEVYVSEPLNEVVMLTTHRSRLLAWLGPIPHWLYFAPLRRQDSVWRQVVLWASGAGCVLAVLGLAIGVRQWRAPYTGWLRWHQITGLVFGACALTWVFSGWLSMEPAAWAAADPALIGSIARQLSGSSTVLPSTVPSTLRSTSTSDPVKEVEWTQILGVEYWAIRTDSRLTLVDVRTMEERKEAFPIDAIVSSVESSRRAAVVSSRLLTEPDAYYYQRDAVLPVLRIVLDDAAQSWVHVDPKTARIVALVNRRDRVERWLYHGLHSLDFPFWYRRRPLWDGGVIVLCAGGLVLSVLGVMLGARRVRRAFRSF